MRTPALLTASLLLLAVSAGAADAGRRVIKINGTDDMKFSVTKINAKPGEKLTVQLTAVGSMAKTEMAHNFVLLAKGVNPDQFVMTASLAKKDNYVPPAKKAQILAATGLAGAGETVSVDFVAPTEPGVYVFVCTFPAHYTAGMKGTLVVQ
jgi:azurin